MMTQPLLVIVTGMPGTGKTTLGRMLASRLGLPFLYKDGIKETLFDSLGWNDREWSRKLGMATYDLLYHVLEMELAARRSLVVESNFDPHWHDTRFRALQARYDFDPFQILCKAEGAVLLERFKQRAASPDRHPGHVEIEAMAELEPVLLQGRLDPLDIGGTLTEVDTTDFARVDIEPLLETLRVALAKAD